MDFLILHPGGDSIWDGVNRYLAQLWIFDPFQRHSWAILERNDDPPQKVSWLRQKVVNVAGMRRSVAEEFHLKKERIFLNFARKSFIKKKSYVK
jgi:hypothetical protein